MNLLETLGGVANQGMPLLTEIHGRNKHDIARITGVPLTRAARWVKVAHNFLRAVKPKKKQAKAIAAATRNGHSIDTLVFIDSKAGKNWDLRLRLCQFAGTHEEIVAEARRLTADRPKHKREPGVRFSADRTTMIVTMDAATIADTEARLRHGVRRDEPEAPQLVENFRAILRDGGVAHAAPRPTIQITLDQHTRILAGDGDEVLLQVTNGTTMTGAEYLRHLFDAHDLLLVHPVEGPVNLYEARFANDKQRRMLLGVQARCCWDGCNRPADYTEVHHVVAHADGGPTNIANLMLLCKYHNGINGLAGRGRMAYINGVPTRVPS